MELKRKYASLNSDSRNSANSIAIIIICALAILIGQGCMVRNIKELEIGFTGLDLETWEPSEYTTNGEWSSTNKVFKRK